MISSFPLQSCIRIAWHARLNQILVGLSDGTVKCYYDQLLSHAGIMNCITKPRKRQRQNEVREREIHSWTYHDRESRLKSDCVQVLREELILSPLTLHMFQPRGDNPDEQEITEWRLRKVLRMR